MDKRKGDHSHPEYQNTGLFASIFPEFQMSGVMISPHHPKHFFMEKVRDVITHGSSSSPSQQILVNILSH
jgi:hypothetical protein